MRVVRQPEGSFLCMAACVAMLLDETLEWVLERAPLRPAPCDPSRQYLHDRDAAVLLLSRGKLMGTWPEWKPGWEPPSSLELVLGMTVEGLDTAPAILGVESRTRLGGEHAVVWCPERRAVLDPQHDEPQPIESYKVLCWIPIRTWEEETCESN